MKSFGNELIKKTTKSIHRSRSLGKRGMEIGALYQFVLLIVLIGMVLGVGGVVLVNFSTSNGVAGTVAFTLINNTLGALLPISNTWIPLIITVAALAIVLTLVIRSFAQRR